ncbi:MULTISPECIES: hypothetical protein [unclassified Treponema]|uniref:hypothetical protein n=1 Tax=unclassified Treponema TaxID=2638727 RepID=UPI0020A409D2|nr:MULTISPECIES: hypothetical protein [unclassified Treponema]UTC66187.1 hypothetical protein E4O06_09230 [Treponema sp. OMZ 789]UTC68916.1 hypothetical protein E4O01_09365 [Treponema sp. OMZ 790]UTC71644.1 hypothetical protein E4O02_09555 [Treponema sp. OMZ 791]
MVKKFRYFSFSYIYLSINEIESILASLYREKISAHKYLMYKNKFNTDLFYIETPLKGGRHLWKAAFYTPKIINKPDNVVMFTNLEDGGITLANRIAIEGKSSHITFSVSNIDEGKNSFTYRDYQRQERVVMTLKDNGKWIFFERGSKLWFENELFYKKRKITERFNSKILLEYCNTIGLDIINIDFWESNNDALFLEELDKNRD